MKPLKTYYADYNSALTERPVCYQTPEVWQRCAGREPNLWPNALKDLNYTHTVWIQYTKGSEKCQTNHMNCKMTTKLLNSFSNQGSRTQMHLEKPLIFKQKLHKKSIRDDKHSYMSTTPSEWRHERHTMLIWPLYSPKSQYTPEVIAVCWWAG